MGTGNPIHFRRQTSISDCTSTPNPPKLKAKISNFFHVMAMLCAFNSAWKKIKTAVQRNGMQTEMEAGLEIIQIRVEMHRN